MTTGVVADGGADQAGADLKVLGSCFDTAALLADRLDHLPDVESMAGRRGPTSPRAVPEDDPWVICYTDRLLEVLSATLVFGTPRRLAWATGPVGCRSRAGDQASAAGRGRGVERLPEPGLTISSSPSGPHPTRSRPRCRAGAPILWCSARRLLHEPRQDAHRPGAYSELRAATSVWWSL